MGGATTEPTTATPRPRWRRWLLRAVREVGEFIGFGVAWTGYVVTVGFIAFWMMQPTHPEQAIPPASRLHGGAGLMLAATCVLLAVLGWMLGLGRLLKVRRELLEGYRRRAEADDELHAAKDSLVAAQDRKIAVLEETVAAQREGIDDEQGGSA